ncbi:hypothetical protein DFJ77DRAFT_508607 [Powellomyces hirtus]|nr:hypothetical protein DFJ77DRAFT_508607 [Powellomyces hirtus]
MVDVPMCGMRAPPDLYSATLHNHLPTSVHLTIHITIDGENVTETAHITQGGSYYIAQRIKDKGTWSMTGVIKEIEIKADVEGRTFGMGVEAPFPGVDSPTKDLELEVRVESGDVVMRSGDVVWKTVGWRGSQ